MTFEFECLNRSGVERVLEDIRMGRHLGLIPITTERAQVMFANPDRAETDTLLVLARDPQGHVVSYAGVMPGRVRFRGEELQVGWLSTGTTTPEFRRTGLSESVITTASTQYPILIANGTIRASANLCRRAGFIETPGPATRQFSVLGIKAIQALRPSALNTAGVVSVSFPGNIAAPPAEHPWFVRTEKHLHWLLDHPWFPKSRNVNAAEQDYWFYDPTRVVTFAVFDTKKDNKTTGSMIVSIRRTADEHIARVLDFCPTDDVSATLLLRAACVHASNESSRALIIPEDALLQSKIFHKISRLGLPERAPFFFKFQNPEHQKILATLHERVTDGDWPFW